jgi:hypothetical protein
MTHLGGSLFLRGLKATIILFNLSDYNRNEWGEIEIYVWGLVRRPELNTNFRAELLNRIPTHSFLPSIFIIILLLIIIIIYHFFAGY